MHLLERHYKLASNEDGLPVSALLGQDRVQHKMLQEACDEAGFFILTGIFVPKDEKVGGNCKDDMNCYFGEISDACGNIVLKDSSLGPAESEVVQNYSNTHTTTDALLLLPNSHFLQIPEHQLETQDVGSVIAYILAAWRRSDSKELPLHRLLHICMC
jgi:hypothetical protein